MASEKQLPTQRVECAACGVIFEYVGTRRLYCDKCKKIHDGKRKIMVEQRKAAKEAEERAAAERLLEYRRQTDPFNYNLMSDRRLDAVIKMFRMTYGTYTAAYRSGFLVQLLKSKGFADPEKMIRELEVE